METIGTQVTDKVMKKILRETAGLGTQATRANIIQTLFQRQFIYKDKKHIKATPLGIELSNQLPNTIKDPLLTAQWEQQLEDIAQNKGQTIDGFLQQQINLLTHIIEQIKKSTSSSAKNNQQKSITFLQENKTCPQCGYALEKRQAVRGKKIGKTYLGCSHFPQCRFYTWC
jgi:DNA topoisomerase-3